MMIQKYLVTKPGFVNTSEGYSKFIFWGNNNVIIPYINIGLMPGNPINECQAVVDYSYYAFEDVYSLLFDASQGRFRIETKQINNNNIIEHILLAGYQTKNGAEVTITCTRHCLYLLESSVINDQFHPFIPNDTPNFRKNMHSEKVKSFFLIDNLPEEIRGLLGSLPYILSFE